MLESLETRMAAYNRGGAKESWESHRNHCSVCGAKKRNPQTCRRGGILKTNLTRANSELKRQKELDAQSHPNQGTLL